MFSPDALAAWFCACVRAASNDKTQAKTQASGEKILASDDAFLQAFKNVSEDLLAGIHGLKDATEKGVSAGAPTTRHVTQCEPAGRE